jgi:hypothetical protein
MMITAASPERASFCIGFCRQIGILPAIVG